MLSGECPGVAIGSSLIGTKARRSPSLRSLCTNVAEALKVGDLLLDRARHEVRAANCVVNCTPKEFLLLGVLMERSGRVQTREQLLNDVWDNDSEIAPRAIDPHVFR